MELVCTHPKGEMKQYFPCDLEQIITDGKSYSDLDRADVHFVGISSESVLTEAKRLNIISESTYRNILLLQRDERKHFQPKTKGNGDSVFKNGVESVSAPSNKMLQPMQVGYFMNRFLVTWKRSKSYSDSSVPEKVSSDQDVSRESDHHHFWSCKICHDLVVEVRHMIESDWLDLSKLSKCMNLDDLQQHKVYIDDNNEQIIEKRNQCLDHLRLSAQRALQLLKSVPVAARRSLPVLVNSQGLLLSIPSIGFTCCPCLEVSCVFKPRVPLGGGHSSFW
uniref:Uncharacterized protein LOC105637727 isoform X2 n=1 Tax=Rhizophora mucronata TaxID=61149 RepID=A0A2P2LH82_RHIMU